MRKLTKGKITKKCIRRFMNDESLDPRLDQEDVTEVCKAVGIECAKASTRLEQRKCMSKTRKRLQNLVD